MMPPDGFISSVLAVESFDDMTALLHGPVGCRRDLSFISSILCPKMPKAPASTYRTRYYANTPRVPCTEVEAEDYVSGAMERLKDALEVVSSADENRLAVINTPGVSLIGESCNVLISEMGLSNRAISLDADYISYPIGEGYDKTLVKILKWLNPVKNRTVEKTVNILGLSVFTRDWKSTLEDLEELLSAMGLRVISVPGARCSIDEYMESVNAELNVVVCSEYCQDLERIYEEDYGVPSVDIHEAPVGFDALEHWVTAIADACSVDPFPALSIIRKKILRARDGMMSCRGSGSIKARTFGAVGDSTIVLPLTKWLYSYLALVPAYIRVTEGFDENAMSELRTFLEEVGCGSALTDPLPDDIYIMAGEGDTVRRMEIGGRCTVGLDIGFPSLYDSNFMKKNVIGQNGTLYILERIVNSRPMMSM